mmetsp:Transcript_107799/g.304947  ORF Transcript_107799/g.304947 Transcript_107799/m.304947 type:complete len:408 (-) Transcript_107799:210-1433(-)
MANGSRLLLLRDARRWGASTGVTVLRCLGSYVLVSCVLSFVDGSGWHAFTELSRSPALPARTSSKAASKPAAWGARRHAARTAEPRDVSMQAQEEVLPKRAAEPLDLAAAGAAGVAGASMMNKQQVDATKTLIFGIVSALLFCGYVFASRGLLPATEWLSCYLIEYSLSIDNLFVFIVIFKYFKVPAKLQSTVLTYGIIGAIIFRFVFVYLGAIVLQQFEFVILGFAAILIYASYTGFTKEEEDDEDEENLDNNFIVQNLRKVLDVSPKFDGDNFFTSIDGRTMITPLLLCLLTIEFSDIVFATDSVPAVLGTTKDQFIAYSSNLFAVWGLRSLFFLLQEAIVSFAYLESAVNVVLGFIGLKIVLDFFGVIQIDVLVSLAIVLGTLVTGIVASIAELNQKKESDDLS